MGLGLPTFRGVDTGRRAARNAREQQGYQPAQRRSTNSLAQCPHRYPLRWPELSAITRPSGITARLAQCGRRLARLARSGERPGNHEVRGGRGRLSAAVPGAAGLTRPRGIGSEAAAYPRASSAAQLSGSTQGQSPPLDSWPRPASGHGEPAEGEMARDAAASAPRARSGAQIAFRNSTSNDPHVVHRCVTLMSLPTARMSPTSAIL
jgi:hypothetical protein